MLYKLAADLLVLIHFSFIIFVVLGGFLVLRWPRVAWIHLPAVSWGIWIEFNNGICPLTTFEKSLRETANTPSYAGNFIDNYIIPIIYPPGFTPETASLLGFALLATTILIYSTAIIRKLRNKTQPLPEIDKLH